ncbi:MAG: hypothetical protein NC935_04375 [Candidatus Omnitrophica bacterium]|nr:hypothetical protein [Candidatus Omnitrophota bacterium]
MVKKFILIAIGCFIFSGSVFAQGLLVNNKEIDEGSTLNLFYDDLEQGKIFFSIKAYKLSKAEITFDQGRTWQEMQKEKDYFIFGYRPLQEEEIRPELLLTEETGSIRTYKPNIKIIYQKRKPDEAVLLVLDKMKLYYEQENIDRFIDLFSTSYPDRIKFKEAIQNDFYNYKNIRLRYRVDRSSFDTDFKGAILDVYWERKYDDRQGTNFSDSANIAIRLEKEGPNWLISGMRGNTIFGSTLLAGADLKITSSDISGDGYTNQAVIHNIGSTEAKNFTVKFYVAAIGSQNYTLDGSAHNISSLAAGSQTTVTHNMFAIPPYTLKVVVDEENVVSESNENNNSATKEFGS